MKKRTIRTYSIIAFVVLPVLIILLGVFMCVFCQDAAMEPSVDFDEVTSETQKGELWETLTIVEGESAYVIYAWISALLDGIVLGDVLLSIGQDCWNGKDLSGHLR